MSCNIVFAFDEEYAQHFCVAYCSLLENNNDLDFNTYILYSELSNKTKNILEEFAVSYHQNIKFIHINDDLFAELVMGYHFKKSHCYRWLIPEVIYEDKVLYLDSDIIVNTSIKKLFDINISNYYLAAVGDMDFNRHEELKMRSDARYFNSGIMLVNIKKWINSGLHEKATRFAEKHMNVIKFVDQDSLNSVVNGEWLSLSPEWNQQTVFFERENFDCFSKQQIEFALNHPAIIHYTGPSKPWQYMNKHPYKKIYWYYLKKTPYRDYKYEDYSLINFIKKYTPKPISLINFIKKYTPKPIKEFIKKVIGKSKKNKSSVGRFFRFLFSKISAVKGKS
jgi:lipopolysaccharide biosynthesis glycosyltransferase